MPFSLLKCGRTVFISAVVAGLLLLLVPSGIVIASVVHPLPGAFLPDLVHTDPVGFIVTDQPSDEFVLGIVVDGDEVTSPFHADELSSPPVVRLGLDVEEALVLLAL